MIHYYIVCSDNYLGAANSGCKTCGCVEKYMMVKSDDRTDDVSFFCRKHSLGKAAKRNWTRWQVEQQHLKRVEDRERQNLQERANKLLAERGCQDIYEDENGDLVIVLND